MTRVAAWCVAVALLAVGLCASAQTWETGTDGLLHISNLVPGGRAETVEDVVNRGDEVTVRVVELNKERGRIGLRLADDPEIADKSVEELQKIGTGNGGRPSGGRREGRDRDRGRGGRDRGGRDRDRRGSRD